MAADDKKSHILSKNNIKPPVSGRCGFFVKRKQRYCKMLPAKGNTFCAEHLAEENDDKETRRRIICPLDNKHTVFADNLERHLKKCNATKKIQLPFYTENINLGLKEFVEEEKIPLYDLPVNEMKQIISRVKSCYALIEGQLRMKENISSHSIIEDELKVPGYGSNVKKHLLQQASLINILETINVLHDDRIIIEFGAGRGALSHWIQKAMKGTRNKFLLVDRQHNRNKLDCYHKGDDQGPNFERLNIDIQHLNLSQVQSLRDQSMSICGVGKHLCGGATDLSLRCLFELQQDDLSCDADQTSAKRLKLGATAQSRVHAVLFALCCYHRCTWNTYVGAQELLRRGFTPKDFHRITKMAAWATCGFERRENQTAVVKESNGNHKGEEYNHDSMHAITENDLKRHQTLGLTTSQQKEIGWMCKRVIDFGRIQYVREKGYDAELITYINNDVTPENIALCVTKPEAFE